MGCTNSKAATANVVGEENRENELAKQPLSSALKQPVEELDPTATAASDDNDPSNKVTVRGATINSKNEKVEEVPVEQPRTGSLTNAEGSVHDGSAVKSNKEVVRRQSSPIATTDGAEREHQFCAGAAKFMATTKTTVDETPAILDHSGEARQSFSSKSPRRRRQRSISSGVKEMMAMVAMEDNIHEDVQHPLTMENVLQPVIPPKKADLLASIEPAKTFTESSTEHMEQLTEPETFTESTTKHMEQLTEPEPKTESVEASNIRNETPPTTFDEAEAPKEDQEENKLPVEIEQTESVDLLGTTEAAEHVKPKSCAACDAIAVNPGDFKVCAKCMMVFYCGRDCQKSHWKKHHKGVCCKASEGAANNSHFQQSWPLSENASNASSDIDSDIHEDAVKELEACLASFDIDGDIHEDDEDAVKELEACLARLRSEDPDLHDDGEGDFDTKPSPSEAEILLTAAIATQEVDAGAAAREATVDSPTAASVDENLAPRGPTKETPPRMQPESLRCAACKREEKIPGSFKSCAKCREVLYCDRRCQKRHMKEHKKMCCKTDSRRKLLGSKGGSLNPIQV